MQSTLVRGQAVRSGTVAGGPGVVSSIQPKPGPEFFTTHGVSMDLWARVFNFDGTSYDIIVSDLKEKTKAKKQIKLGLLLGIKSLLETGTPTLSKDSLFELCKSHAAYDQANFAVYMKKHKNWFLQKGDAWTLTVPGMEEAVTVIKELAQ